MTLLDRLTNHWRRRRHTARHAQAEYDAWLDSLDWTIPIPGDDAWAAPRRLRPAAPPIKEIH